MLRNIESNKIAAFSLVELSIVLVILGLLVGGVLSGQSLIRAAELRSVTTDADKYAAAVRTFQDKYFQLPGDMNNATQFWGALGGCPTTYNAGQPKLTCNGDGNGLVGDVDFFEIFRFWQHLSSAELLEGRYAGVNGTTVNGGALVQPGINVPASRLSRGAFTVQYLNQPCGGGGSSYLGICNGEHLFYFGTVQSYFARTPIMTASEAWNIDTKIDDGRPGYGRVQTPSSNSSFQPNCVTTNVQATAEYALSNTGIECGLLFLLLK